MSPLDRWADIVDVNQHPMQNRLQCQIHAIPIVNGGKSSGFLRTFRSRTAEVFDESNVIRIQTKIADRQIVSHMIRVCGPRQR